MTMLDVYVGDLDDTQFEWENGNWNGNLPKKLSPLFPYGHDYFRLLLKKIKNEECEGKKVDWGGWVAKMYPSDILSFVQEIELKNEGQELLDFLHTLDSKKKYAVVAYE